MSNRNDNAKGCVRKCANCAHIAPRGTRWCSVKAITIPRPYDPVDCRCWHEASSEPLKQIFLRAKPPHGEAKQAGCKN